MNMPSRVFSAAIIGLNAQIIEVEVEVNYGLRCFNIVGLPDKTVEESKERVGAAIKSSGFKSPHSQSQRVLVNLAPADLKKEGSWYDLPIALGYLNQSGQIKFKSEGKIFIGELALDGSLRPVKGALSLALAGKEKGWAEIILPKANAQEAALAQDIKIIGIENLREAIEYLTGRKSISPFKADLEKFLDESTCPIDINWIKGQEYAKRALEITAAGAHNLLMTGPPGGGKSLLAKAIPSILPKLSFNEALEVTKIYSVTGLLAPTSPLISQRPFRSPHHTSSGAALIGGGNPSRPGEITLAHRGVLFLDEFPEFHRDVLESLRQPLEEGEITVLRAKQRLNFPCRFILVAAANPCPCGYLNDPIKPCICQPSQIARYQRKLSGPLMDRMDLFVELPSVKYEKLASQNDENPGIEIKNRVKKAREIQKERFKSKKILTNSEIEIPQIKQHCHIDSKSQNVLKMFVNSGKLSARGYHRVLKVARTIADLDESENISYEHLTEALMYRAKDHE